MTKQEDDVEFYVEALIGSMESVLDRGALSEEATGAVREIIKRLRAVLSTREAN